ncbi:hypothetical protein WJX74_005008 [Apatococcus lobatus]|uniref:NADP-dependent oxidoreductase domain-containing protein n=1 Tax=Apatococcus lobatus TaxID=904363 RepID=A0AAW1QPA1_9CHLO
MQARCNTTALLASGYDIPLVGLGTWKSEPGRVTAAVKSALASGYRHIDCAAIYKNEDEVGNALAASIHQGVVRREDVFITSKLWNSDHSDRRVKAACLKSMRDLRVDYLDLYLIHWPVTGNRGPDVQPPLLETWKAMQDLVCQGLVRSIGVSNFSVSKMEGLMTAPGVPLSVCQVECHPYFRNDGVHAWCKQQGIHMTAYSPLGSADSASLLGRNAQMLLQNETLLSIANDLKRSPAEVLLQWGLRNGTSILPKSTSSERIKANLASLDWQLPQVAFEALNNLDYQRRMVDGSFWVNPAGPYSNLEELWK